MSLIFHRFPSADSAQAFAFEVEHSFGLASDVFVTQGESNEVDPFPFELTPPVVQVERSDDQRVERQVEAFVVGFGGEFSGT